MIKTKSATHSPDNEFELAAKSTGFEGELSYRSAQGGSGFVVIFEERLKSNGTWMQRLSDPLMCRK